MEQWGEAWRKTRHHGYTVAIGVSVCMTVFFSFFPLDSDSSPLQLSLDYTSLLWLPLGSLRSFAGGGSSEPSDCTIKAPYTSPNGSSSQWEAIGNSSTWGPPVIWNEVSTDEASADTENTLSSAGKALGKRTVPNYVVVSKERNPRMAFLTRALLSWSPEAEEMVVRALEENQHPRDCSQRILLAPETQEAGLGSIFHQWQRMMRFGVSVNMTVLLVPNPIKSLIGCDAEKRHLGCFFEGLSGCHVSLSVWTAINVTENIHLRWPEMIKSKTRMVRTPWRDTGEFYNGTDPVMTWQKKLFARMVERGLIATVPGTFPADVTDAEIDSMFRGIVTKWMFKPNQAVMDIAKAIMFEFQQNPSLQLKPPVVGLHIRRTDKGIEDKYYLEHNGTFPSVSHFLNRIREQERVQNYTWTSIFVMTDDRAARQEILDLQASGNLTKVVLYDSIAPFLMSDFVDHDHVPVKFDLCMLRHFVASLEIMRQVADLVVVREISNVGRLLKKLLAGRKRTVQRALVCEKMDL